MRVYMLDDLLLELGNESLCLDNVVLDISHLCNYKLKSFPGLLVTLKARDLSAQALDILVCGLLLLQSAVY